MENIMKLILPFSILFSIAGSLAAAVTHTNSEVTTDTLNSSTKDARTYNVLTDGYVCTSFVGGAVIIGNMNADYSNYNSLTISNGATVNCLGGTIGEGVSFETRGAHNTVTVTGSASRWTCQGLSVGEMGFANTLLIKDGGTVTCDGASIGEGFSRMPDLGGSNKVIVDGQGSSFVDSGDLTLGQFNHNNALMIENGASASARLITLGMERWSCNGNHLLVTGRGSVLAADLCVGNTGSDSSATVSDGALLEASSFVISESASTENNQTTVTGKGSTLTIGTKLTIGGSSKGLLTLANGGIVRCDGSVALSVNGNIRLAKGYLAQVGDKRDAYAALVASGSVLVYDTATSSWKTATANDVTITYYAEGEDQAAETATGYTGLGGSTVMTGGSNMPESFGSAATLANDRYDSPWFGAYWAKPASGGYWIWHDNHGWAYLSVLSNTEAMMWDDATQSWWYIGRDFYPYLYNYATGSWYYYIEGVAPNREFWSYRDNARVGEAAIKP
jgi:T5SS/PEP-CTERM-associated repeat protein